MCTRLVNHSATLVLLFLLSGCDFLSPYERGIKQVRLQNYTQAIPLLAQSASEGFAPAQNQLGQMYREGLGVEPDHVHALSLFQSAANQGYAAAEYNLGQSFELGLGTSQDPVQALVWYRRAAEKGDWRAFVSIGGLYERSEETSQNDRTAIEWYLRAGQFGSTEAITRLISIYSRTNPGAAYKWCLIAHNLATASTPDCPKLATNLNESQRKTEEDSATEFLPDRFMLVPFSPGSWTVRGLTIGLFGLGCGVLMLYLAGLAFSVRGTQPDNSAVALLLSWEALTLIFLALPFAFPATDIGLLLANLMKNLSVPVLVTLPFCYLPLVNVLRQRAGITSTTWGFRATWVSVVLAFSAGIFMYLAFRDTLFYASHNPDGPGMRMYVSLHMALFTIVMYILANAVLLDAVMRVHRSARTDADLASARAYVKGLVVKFSITGFAMSLLLVESQVEFIYFGGSGRTWLIGLFVLGELIFALLFCYGVVSQQILGIESLFRKNVARVLLGGSAVLGFFAAEQVLEGFATEELGQLGGMAVAVVVLLGHNPIMHKFEQWLTAMFGEKRTRASGEAVSMYRLQYQTAREGGITLKERRMLRLTARALGLTAEQATDIETAFDKS